jgi:hypothetical protein
MRILSALPSRYARWGRRLTVSTVNGSSYLIKGRGLIMHELRLVRGGLTSSPAYDPTGLALAELKEENKRLREQLASLVFDLASLLKEQKNSG